MLRLRCVTVPTSSQLLRLGSFRQITTRLDIIRQSGSNWPWVSVENPPTLPVALEVGQYCPGVPMGTAFSRLWPPNGGCGQDWPPHNWVFITFGGSQGHEGRLSACGGLTGRLPRILSRFLAPSLQCELKLVASKEGTPCSRRHHQDRAHTRIALLGAATDSPLQHPEHAGALRWAEPQTCFTNCLQISKIPRRTHDPSGGMPGA